MPGRCMTPLSPLHSDRASQCSIQAIDLHFVTPLSRFRPDRAKRNSTHKTDLPFMPALSPSVMLLKDGTFHLTKGQNINRSFRSTFASTIACHKAVPAPSPFQIPTIPNRFDNMNWMGLISSSRHSRHSISIYLNCTALKRGIWRYRHLGCRIACPATIFPVAGPYPEDAHR